MNPVKKKLKQGQVTVGSWMQLPSSSVAEIMGQANYDWVAMDMEHGLFSVESLVEICRALELGGTLPFVRLAQATSKDIKQALEAGAQGLIFPMIETPEQLQQAIDWSLYPPQGKRGVGYSRTNLFGKHFDEIFNQKEALTLIAQIEHISAVNTIDSILQVPELDGIIIGPYDLSASMGLTGQFNHPDFIDALNTLRDSAKAHGVPMGLHIVQPDPDLLKEKINEGYQFIAYSIDAVFLYRAAQSPITN